MYAYSLHVVKIKLINSTAANLRRGPRICLWSSHCFIAIMTSKKY